MLPNANPNDLCRHVCTCLNEGRAADLDSTRVNNGITQLNLEGMLLDPAGVRALGEFLTISKTVQVLNLGNVRVAPNGNGAPVPPGTEGAHAIASGLKNNRSLVSLSLDGWHVGNDGAGSIAEALCGKDNPTTLSLDENSITSGGGPHILDLLARSQVRTLSLRGNHLPPKTLQDMAASFSAEKTVFLDDQRPALRHPRTLRQITGSPLETFATGALPTEDAWVVMLIDVLVAVNEDNEVFEWLNQALLVGKREVLRHRLALWAPFRFRDGVQMVPTCKLPLRLSSVAQWLKGAPPIRQLELEVGALTHADSECLAKALKTNGYLTHLRVTETERAGGVGMPPHAATFAKLLETNESLVELTVVGCREAEPAVRESAKCHEAKIREALGRNRAIAKRAATAGKAAEATRALREAPAAHWLPEELGGMATSMIVDWCENEGEANATLTELAYFALQQPEQPPQQGRAAAPGNGPQSADAPGPARD
jgi:hypothetical protein